MSRRIRQAGYVLALALVSACGGRSAHPLRSPSQRDLITREDIERTHAVTALDAVERLRGSWLRRRGTTQLPGSGQFTEPEIQVYLDDQRLGTVDNLARIEIAVVQYIRFYGPADASARWGLNHGAGAIQVSTRPLEHP